MVILKVILSKLFQSQKIPFHISFLYFFLIQDSNNECEKCSSECKTCESASDICTSCPSDDYTISNNACISTKQSICETGAYYDDDLNDCRLCDITCAECNANTDDRCTKCLPKRPFLKSGICLASCPDGFYSDEATNLCLKCDQNCDKCVKSSKNCASCVPGFDLNNKQECVSSLLMGNLCLLKIQLNYFNIYRE